MRQPAALAFAIILLATASVGHAAGQQHSRKLKQGAGVGAGCNSVFNEADNGSGYTVEDTENALAGDVGPAKLGKRLLASLGLTHAPHHQARKLKQGAGVGQGCDSVFTQLDNGSGYTVEDTENAVAGDLGGKPTANGGGTGRKLLSSGMRSLKQLNKVVDGFNNLATAAGDPQLGHAVDVVGNDYDTQGTNDAAADGAMIGEAEASIPEITEAIPGRKLAQLNKIVDGFNNLATAAGDPQLGNAVDVVGNDYDNQGTNDAAALGAQVGDAEASIPEITEAIPGR